MRSMDSEHLSATLKDKDFEAPSRPGMLGTTDRINALAAKRDKLVVIMDEYKMCEENLETKVIKQMVLVTVMTESVKQLETKVTSLQDENNYL